MYLPGLNNQYRLNKLFLETSMLKYQNMLLFYTQTFMVAFLETGYQAESSPYVIKSINHTQQSVIWIMSEFQGKKYT